MNYTGLSEHDVLKSREAHGRNIVPPPPEKSLFLKYLEKFSDPLIIILLVAGALSLGISFYEYKGLDKGAEVFFEPVGIFMAIILATGLGFIFELKAAKEFALLNKTSDNDPVAVIRDGKTVSVPKQDIVVGDIVILSTGDEIPADARLLESTLLNVDESTLTGEPSCHKSENPAEKDPEATFPTDVVLKGTKVLEGHGIAEVTAVGPHTESGKVFIRASIDDSVKTPLNEQLERLGGLIANTSYVLAGLIIFGRLVIYFTGGMPFSWVEFGSYFLQSVMIAVALIVVAVPEGLPMAVTLSLAYSMRRMLKTNNLVRKLHACETMGAVTVICTDKTGTLTQNKMRVDKIYPQAGIEEDLNKYLWAIALNSTAKVEDGQVFGNPTEGALLQWAIDKGADISKIRNDSKIIAEIPFNTQKKYMAVACKTPDGVEHTFIKGAPEIIAEFYKRGDDKDGSMREVEKLQNCGMRVIAFAEAPGNIIQDGELKNTDEIRFIGLFGIIDPVRGDVPVSVADCVKAGINVKMITGDAPLTAYEIAKQANIPVENMKTATGPEIAAMTDTELASKIEKIAVVSRARPLDKERIAKALQSRGQVVAMTGDGTNDAPALNAAHVGLSMGSGTAVAKDASDITIIDDSFASIARAVMWGRSLYANIQRFILFQMTVNVAACLTVLAGAFTSAQSPLTVTQMLWVNLIMDTFAAMALASLPPREEVMLDKPRDREDFIITPGMKKNIMVTGGIFFAILLFFALWLERRDVYSMQEIMGLENGPGLTAYESSLFFTFFVMLQWWNLFNAKAWRAGKDLFDFKGCEAFMFIACLIFIGQILITCFGGGFFNVAPLSAMDWFWIVLLTSPVLIIGEIIRKRKERENDIEIIKNPVQ